MGSPSLLRHLHAENSLFLSLRARAQFVELSGSFALSPFAERRNTDNYRYVVRFHDAAAAAASSLLRTLFSSLLGRWRPFFSRRRRPRRRRPSASLTATKKNLLLKAFITNLFNDNGRRARARERSLK